jgi:hypothetical protein
VVLNGGTSRFRKRLVGHEHGHGEASMMSIRRLFAILVALAVLIAPAVTASAAASEPHHEMQMMKVGHCQGPVSGSADHDRNAGKTCCISICMAVAAFAVAAPLEGPVQISPPVFSAPVSLAGQPTELATPPPRNSRDFA